MAIKPSDVDRQNQGNQVGRQIGHAAQVTEQLFFLGYRPATTIPRFQLGNNTPRLPMLRREHLLTSREVPLWGIRRLLRSTRFGQQIPYALPTTPNKESTLGPAPCPARPRYDHRSNRSTNRNRMMLQPIDTLQYDIAAGQGAFQRHRLLGQGAPLHPDACLERALPCGQLK